MEGHEGPLSELKVPISAAAIAHRAVHEEAKAAHLWLC